MTPVRLAPGVFLVAVPGQGLAVRTPDGEFLRVDTGAVPPGDLVTRLTEGGGAREPRLDALVSAFEEAGYAGNVDTAPPAPLAGRTVLVLGDPPLTGPLARCVREAGGRVRTGGPEDVRALVSAEGDLRTAVVWCLDGPVPVGLWDEADRLPAAGAAWLRCHREGAQVWLEPPAFGPGDVTSADVRLRRLAATPAHRELVAYWDGPRAGDGGPGHHAASAALTVALLTADLLTWANGPATAPSRTTRRHLRRIDIRTLALTEHPILPVPPIAGGRPQSATAVQHQGNSGPGGAC
ncbi:hypothetical protein [Streptomyces lateritius]|uniref:hypothetical protein n=1 Tax=Streptomyces lateritius TaxID=67313 RepID=UPI0016757E72|nr:hypothetical protein [Streptomyces lateritius]GGT98928.1 hypothetical protein GCM10010272_49800 [Streptomyces lateritius]